MSDFASLLEVDASKIEKPKPLPVGTYECTITDYEMGESSQKKTPYVRIHLGILAADADVDSDELAAFGEVNGKKLRTDFYITEASVFMLKSFLQDTLGFDIEGRSISQMLPEIKGQCVKAEVTHRVSQDGENVFAEVKKTLAA